jgi:hypothetical protein
MKLGGAFAFCFLFWLIGGVLWLLPKKLAILRRLGHRTYAELILKGDGGDAEVQTLRRLSWWYIGIGLAVLVPLSFFNNLIQ